MSRFITYLVTLLVAGLLAMISPEANAQSVNNEQRFEINASTKKLSVYPTPASSFVNISVPMGLREQVDKIQIIDISGRVVMEQKILNKNISEVSFYNLSTLVDGVYIIVARDREGRMIQSSKMILDK